MTGLSGSGLTLQLNGGAGLVVAADGTFTFATALPSGAAYTVIVGTQPSGERCKVSSGTGTVTTTNVTNVTVNCSTVLGFLYQLSWGNVNQVYSYRISADTGLLTPFGAPIETPPSPFAITVAPGGHYVYVTNGSGAEFNTADLPGSISTFAVDPDTGTLTSVGSPVAVGSRLGAGETAISASGYLFVYDWNGPNVAALTPAGPQSLIEYKLDPSSGTPSLMGTVLTFPVNAETSFALTPDGRFLYVLTGSPQLNTPIPNTLTVYAIDPTTGALTPGSSISPGDTVNATAMTIDPKGRFLYLTNSLGTPIQVSGTVQPYAIDSTSGALTAVGTATSVVSNGDRLCADPSGRYLYLGSDLNFTPATDTVQALSVDQSTGSVSTMGSIIQTAGAPDAVVCDPSGQFVFVQSFISSPALLTTFSISTSPGSAGQLIPSGPSQSSTGQGALAIAIVE